MLDPPPKRYRAGVQWYMYGWRVRAPLFMTMKIFISIFILMDNHSASSPRFSF